MNFEPILYGPLFVRDAPDINLVASGADPVEVTVAVGGSSWPLPVTPVLTDGRYLAPLRMREILGSVVVIPGLADAGEREVPLVTLTAEGTSMSLRAMYGGAAGKTPTELAGHWLSWRDQVSKTYAWGRERLTFLAGRDLLGWRSGSYSVKAKVYLASGDPVTVTLVSGTLPEECRYVTVDASYAAIAALVSGTIRAWDVSYSFSGRDSGNANASLDGFPLRLVLARQDVRVKEFVFCNSFGVEDRVYSSGRSNPKLEGASVAFLNGAVEQELRNDATEGREVFSGYLGSARESALWLDFLKAHERHILLSGGLARIIVDTQDTDLQDNAIGSVKFTYHLGALDAGRHFDDLEGLGEYDPTQRYGALYVGDEPASEDLPTEDLFFLKTRLDEFPAADLDEDLLFLVQNPLTQAWGNASLSNIKAWLQDAIHAYQTPVWSGPWADYAVGVADYALAASLGKDLDDRIRAIERSPYSLPIATDTVLGGIKVGDGLAIAADGTLSAGDRFFEVDADVEGGVKLKSAYSGLRAERFYLTDDVYFSTEEINGTVCVRLNAPFITDGDQIILDGEPGGGGGGETAYLNDLLDVAITSPSNGQALVYRNGEWVNETVITDLSDYYTKVQTDTAISTAISALNLGAAATYGIGSVASGNTGLVTGGSVYSAINSALSSVLKFVGTTTSNISDGSTLNPIVIGGSSYTAVTGNVVLKGNKEYLWNGSSWEELGDEESWALKTVTISAGTGLTGGGTLEANRTISLSAASIASLALADSALQSSDIKTLALKVGTITIGSGYNPIGANDTTLTITAQNLYDTIGDTKYHPYGGSTTLATFKIGGATLTWHPETSSGAGDAYIELDTALITSGDQIVMSGTPGGGGGGGGAGLLTDLNDIYPSAKPSAQKILVFDPNQYDKIGNPGAWVYADMPTGSITSVTKGTAVSGGAVTTSGGVVTIQFPTVPTVSFGTAGSDYIPITLGGTTKNVLTAHQSLSAYLTSAAAARTYLPLSAGSSKPLTGTLYIDTSAITSLIITNTATSATVNAIRFNLGNSAQGYFGMQDGQLFRANSDWSSQYIVYDSGNLSITTLAGSSAVGSVAQPVYYTGSAFATVQATFGSQNYGEHDANNIASNGLWYYNSNGPATSLGASTYDGALYSQAYSTNWVGQIAQDYRNGRLFVRGKNNGTWQSWLKVWDSGNLTPSDYVLKAGDTMTGGLIFANNFGVSGTDSGGSARTILYLNSNNHLVIGNGMKDVQSGGNTVLRGIELHLQTSARDGSYGDRVIVNSSGNVTIGASDLAENSYKLYVIGASRVTGQLYVGTSSVGNINFLRGSANYITAPADGYFTFIPNGLTTNNGNSPLIVTAGSVYPGTDTDLGRSSSYWHYAYVDRLCLATGVYLEYNSQNGYIYISKPIVTEGDQIVASGTPGGGGGTGGAGFVYELKDTLAGWTSNTGVSTGQVLMYQAGANSKNGTGTGAWKFGTLAISNISGLQSALDGKQASGNYVTSVKVGSTSYAPSSGVVSLPAYPTTLPASDVYAWAKASAKPSYTLDEVSDGSTRKLSNYVSLSGTETISGVKTFTGGLYLKSDNARMIFQAADGTVRGNVAMRSAGVLEFYDLSAYRTIWHAGNASIANSAITLGSVSLGTSSAPIGYASNATAATYANRLTRRNGTNSAGGYDLSTILAGGGITSQYGSDGYWANGPTGMTYGGAMEFHAYHGSSATGNSLNIQFAWDINHNTSTPTRYLWYRSANNLGWANDWHLVYDSANANLSTVPWACKTLSAGSNNSGWTGTFASTNSAVYLANASGSAIYAATKLSDTSGYLLDLRYGQTTLGSGGSYALYVRSDGNVGIGTNAPSYPLHVVGPSSGSYWAGHFKSTTSQVSIANSAGRGIAIESTDNASSRYLLNCIYGQSTLGSGGTSAFYVQSDGNVGVGTNAPASKLHVNGGNIYLQGGFFRFDAGQNINALGSGYAWQMVSLDDSLINHFGYGGTGGVRETRIYGNGISFYNSSRTKIATITNAGDVGIGTDAPGARLEIANATSIPVLISAATSMWAYIRFTNVNTSTNSWDIGTVNSTGTDIAQANAFEIRDVADSRSGISIRHATSSYGKLVVRVPSGQCSIGYWSAADNPVSGSPVWTVGFTADSDKTFGWYYRASSGSGWKMLLDGDGNLTHNGVFNTSTVNLRRSTGTSYGRISFYSPTYKTWFLYMSNRVAGGAPNGSTPAAGSVVTNWALRSVIENSTGYGWIWESNANTATTAPTIMMELSATSGTLATKGDQVVSSDATLKKNWRDLKYGIADIAKATAGVFDWKDGRGSSAGTKAQDWKPLIPELVHGEEGSMTLAYGQIAMLNTIILARHENEQDKEIKRLKARVEDLEKQLKIRS